jgi:hypothetical protein
VVVVLVFINFTIFSTFCSVSPHLFKLNRGGVVVSRELILRIPLFLSYVWLWKSMRNEHDIKGGLAGMMACLAGMESGKGGDMVSSIPIEWI